MRSSVPSSWNDLGVWYSERDGCGSCVSVHLHHSQLATGTLVLLDTANFERRRNSIEFSGILGKFMHQ